MADRRSIFLDLYTKLIGHGARDAARELDQAGTSADRAGKSFRGFTGDTQGLKSEIDRTTDSISKLRAEIGRTGDRGLFPQLAREELALKRMRRLADELVPDRTVGMRMPRLDMSQFVGETRGMLIALLVGFLAASAPAIGAMVGGAVVGAAGSGGIIGGVVAASTDARVKDAWRDLGASITADDFGKDAFITPTLGAIGELKDAIHDMDIGVALKEAAPDVLVLAKGIGDLGRNLMPGLRKAMANAGPTIKALAAGLGSLGDGLGYMFARMSEGRGATAGMLTLMSLLEGVVRVTGNAVHWLGEQWLQMVNAEAKVMGVLEDIPLIGDILGADRLNDWAEKVLRLTDEMSTSTDAASGSMSDFSRYLAEATNNAEALHIQLRELFGEQMAVDEATLRWNKSLLELRKTFAENGRTLSMNTERGIENRQMILNVIQSAIDLRDAMIANGASVNTANTEYNQFIETLRRQLEMLGLTKQQIDDLVAAKYGPVNIPVVISLTDQSKGMLQAAMAVDAATRTQGFFPPYTHLAQPPNPNAGTGSGSAPGSAPPPPAGPSTRNRVRNWWEGLAGGGPSPVGTPYWVGEHGKELRFDTSPGYVVDHNTSMAMAGGAGGYGGGGAMTLTIRSGGGSDFEDLFAEMIRRYVRVSYEGDVQAAFGR